VRHRKCGNGRGIGADLTQRRQDARAQSIGESALATLKDVDFPLGTAAMLDFSGVYVIRPFCFEL
jgi:hypothetical protein